MLIAQNPPTREEEEQFKKYLEMKAAEGKTLEKAAAAKRKEVEDMLAGSPAEAEEVPFGDADGWCDELE